MRARSHLRRARSKILMGGLSASALMLGIALTSGVTATASTTGSPSFTPAPQGELDCNGFSTVQKPLGPRMCTDISGNIKGAWGGHYYDNGHYIGHDEPDATFLSSAPGSGNNVTWTETIGRDPSAAATVVNPGHDVSHWAELSPAPWLSMAMCDPNSFPGTPCTPESDSNAPTCFGLNCTAANSGGGSAFMEMQLYPPGEPPFINSTSCDDTHWCAALTIDSFTGTPTTNANPACQEPANFAFIQRNGVPTGPPGPETDTTATFVNNNETLLMNPGDTIVVHMADAPAPGGGDAFEVVIDDLTTHQSGFMQASAANGFTTTSAADCSSTPFNFQPEYNTAAKNNIIPWAALQTNISTEFETGHWEECTSLADPIANEDPGDTGGAYNECLGPYENAAPPDNTTDELGDAVCYPAGDTHPGFDGPGTSTQPDEFTACQANEFQNGDLDFDGTPYWTEWPTGLQPTIYPSSFLDSFPISNGRQYPQFYFQTDIALSEATCQGNSQPGFGGTLAGCTVPPPGPGGFYPYWSSLLAGSYAFGGSCSLEFGNVSNGIGVNDYGKDTQYGTNLEGTLGYPEFEGTVHSNPCAGTYL